MHFAAHLGAELCPRYNCQQRMACAWIARFELAFFLSFFYHQVIASGWSWCKRISKWAFLECAVPGSTQTRAVTYKVIAVLKKQRNTAYTWSSDSKKQPREDYRTWKNIPRVTFSKRFLFGGNDKNYFWVGQRVGEKMSLCLWEICRKHLKSPPTSLPLFNFLL